MSDPTPQRNRDPLDDRPLMGDHPELEESQVPPPMETRGPMAQWMGIGVVVLIIVVALIAYFLFFD